MFASSLAVLPASLGSSAAIAPSIRNGRPAAPYGLQYSLAYWAYYGLFRALRAASVRPTGCAASFALIGLTPRCFVPQFAIVALQRLTACNAPLFIGLPLRLFRALRAAKLRPTGRALRAPLAPPAASRPPIVHCASLRVLATSVLRASDVRKLTRGFLCLTGLTTACFRHWRRPSCAPFPFGKKEALGQGYFIR